MTYIQEEIIDLKNLYENISGESQRVTSNFDDILVAVLKGQKTILVDLEWNEEVNGENYKRNKILVTNILDENVIFMNPLKNGTEKAGLLIEGENKGPTRMVNNDMTQYMKLDNFENIFKSYNGSAYSRCKLN